MRLASQLALLFAGLHLCTTVAADEQWYAGASVGIGEANEVSFEDIDDGSALSGSTSDDDTGFKFFAGYAYNEFFAIEMSFVDLGEVSINADSDGSGFLFLPGKVVSKVEASGISVSVVARMPINEKFRAFARFGYFAWEADTRLSNSAFGDRVEELDGSDPTFGIGAEYQLKDRFAIRAEFEKYSDINDVDGSLTSVGVAISF